MIIHQVPRQFMDHYVCGFGRLMMGGRPRKKVAFICPSFGLTWPFLCYNCKLQNCPKNLGLNCRLFKVQLFWEGHNLRNLPHALDIYLVNIQTIVQIFVAFSEKRNFNDKMTILWLPNNMWSLIPIVVDIWLNALKVDMKTTTRQQQNAGLMMLPAAARSLKTQD